MFFSIIEPAPGAERDAAFDRLDGPYAEHQWLWRFFPAREGTPRDFVFRRMDGGFGSRFYVVSARKPDTINSAWGVQTLEYAPRLQVGQRFRFDLRVNPVITVMRDGKSCRDDVVMHQKKYLLQQRGLKCWADWKGDDKPPEYELVQTSCARWLCESSDSRPSRADRAGFSVIHETLRADGYIQHEASRKGVRFSTVDLSGEIEVRDPNRLLSVLQGGLGRGKAFGCGLILVRPVSDG
jgi:CRISPR system Cascade subunit CasE